MDKATLAQQVRHQRGAVGWSQQRLAEEAKLSIDTVRSVETGRNTNPTLFVIKQLQKAFDTTFEL